MTVARVKLPPNPIRHFYRGGPAIAELRGIDVGGDHSPEEWIGAVGDARSARRARAQPPAGRHAGARRLAADPEALAGRRPRRALRRRPRAAGQAARRRRAPARPPPPRAARSRASTSAWTFGKTEAWIIVAAEPGRRGQRRLGARTSDEQTLAVGARPGPRRAARRAAPARGQRGRRDLRPRRRRRTRSATGILHRRAAGADRPLDPARVGRLRDRDEAQATLGLGWERALSSVERSRPRRAGAARPARPAARSPSCSPPPPRPSSAPSASPRAAARSRLPAGFAVVIVVEAPAPLAGLDVTRGDALLVPHAAGPVSAARRPRGRRLPSPGGRCVTLLLGIDVGTTAVQGRGGRRGRPRARARPGADALATRADGRRARSRRAAGRRARRRRRARCTAPEGRVAGIGVASMAETGVLLDAARRARASRRSPGTTRAARPRRSGSRATCRTSPSAPACRRARCARWPSTPGCAPLAAARSAARAG